MRDRPGRQRLPSAAVTTGEAADGLAAGGHAEADRGHTTLPRPAARAARLVRPAAIVRKTALPAADVAGLAGAIAVSGAGRAPAAAVVYAAAVLAVLAAGRMHRLRVCLRASDQAGHILSAATVPVPVLLIWPSHPAATAATATTLAGLALAATALILAARIGVCMALRAAHRRGRLTERAVVVGAGTFGAFIAELMREHPELGLTPAGFIDDGPPRLDLPMPTLGTMRELATVIADGGIGRVIVCFSTACRDEDLVETLRACRPLPSDICVAPRLYELGMAVRRDCLDEIWGVPLIPLRTAPRAGLALKRSADFAIAFVLCLITAPLTLTLAAAIRIRSGSPVLFRQPRLTGDRTVVPILKLRTMPVPGGSDARDPDTQWAVDEERCDAFERWLRATHLDELPQLFQVLRGEMSLVGPRPERPYFAQQFSRDIPRYADRIRMPGGLTGWAQVHGLNGDTSLFDRARFDNYYAEYWSPWLDAVILTRTVLQVSRIALGLT
jgi:lipopolysaccharide/colanic/teichoic acid biosynthesis glycosyltransferase